MHQFWASVRSFFRSRYVAYLEAEVERLRTDNSRLYDALLVKNGLPALTPRPDKTLSRKVGGRPLPSQFARQMSIDSLPSEKPQ